MKYFITYCFHVYRFFEHRVLSMLCISFWSSSSAHFTSSILYQPSSPCRTTSSRNKTKRMRKTNYRNARYDGSYYDNCSSIFSNILIMNSLCHLAWSSVCCHRDGVDVMFTSIGNSYHLLSFSHSTLQVHSEHWALIMDTQNKNTFLSHFSKTHNQWRQTSRILYIVGVISQFPVNMRAHNRKSVSTSLSQNQSIRETSVFCLQDDLLTFWLDNITLMNPIDINVKQSSYKNIRLRSNISYIC